MSINLLFEHKEYKKIIHFSWYENRIIQVELQMSIHLEQNHKLNQIYDLKIEILLSFHSMVIVSYVLFYVI